MVTYALGFAASAHAVNAFVFGCNFSHMLRDDPIVSPHMLGGAAHLHDFIGNRTTNADSTRDSLFLAPTNCTVFGDPIADKSGYWIPTLGQYQAAGIWQPINPVEVTVYYNGYDPAPTAVRPFPIGLRMIGGDSRATAAQPLWKVSWACAHATAPDPAVPRCVANPADPGPILLRLRFIYPRCWDGVSTDSPDHKAHVVYPPYPGSSVCPPTNSVPVPEIGMYVLYRTAGGPAAGATPMPGDVALSSGGVYSMHADFMEAWNSLTLQQLIARCLWVHDSGCTG
jgi:hypothetical protein